MDIYAVYFNCPKCKQPCDGKGPTYEGNECITANSAKEAREMFTKYKPCRHQKITRVIRMGTTGVWDNSQQGGSLL